MINAAECINRIRDEAGWKLFVTGKDKELYDSIVGILSSVAEARRDYDRWKKHPVADDCNRHHCDGCHK